MIKVVVGEKTKKPSRPFFVHAGLLTSRSTFFATALQNYWKADHDESEGDTEQTVQNRSIQWQEVKERVVKLPVDDPAFSQTMSSSFTLACSQCLKILEISRQM
jgi:hypothetical protein